MRSIVPIGPFHPLQEEPELFRLHVDGETVVDIDVEIGWNHRGIEKICETKTFDQVPFVVEGDVGLPVLTALACPYTGLADEDRSICAVEKMVFSELTGEDLRLRSCRLDGQDYCTFELN